MKTSVYVFYWQLATNNWQLIIRISDFGYSNFGFHNVAALQMSRPLIGFLLFGFYLRTGGRVFIRPTFRKADKCPRQSWSRSPARARSAIQTSDRSSRRSRRRLLILLTCSFSRTDGGPPPTRAPGPVS